MTMNVAQPFHVLLGRKCCAWLLMDVFKPTGSIADISRAHGCAVQSTSIDTHNTHNGESR